MYFENEKALNKWKWVNLAQRAVSLVVLAFNILIISVILDPLVLYLWA